MSIFLNFIDPFSLNSSIKQLLKHALAKSDTVESISMYSDNHQKLKIAFKKVQKLERYAVLGDISFGPDSYN